MLLERSALSCNGQFRSAGMFVAIITSILAVEIYRLTDKSKFKITMPEQVPPAVARSFEALTPTLVIILEWVRSLTISALTGTRSWQSRWSFSQCRRHLASVLLITFLTTFFWSFGIHGASIVGSLARPLWLQLLEGNTTALASGDMIQYRSRTILSMVHLDRWGWFNDWFGYLVSVSHQIEFGSKLGKTALIPAIFQHQRTTDFRYTDRFEPNLDPTFHHCTTDQWRHCVGRYLSWFSQCSYGQCPLDIAWTNWRFLSDWRRRLACDRAECSFDSFIDPDLLPIRKNLWQKRGGKRKSTSRTIMCK